MPSLSLADLACIEDAALNASAAQQQRWLDGWLLCFSPGKAKRARCVSTLAAGHLALADKLALCERVYADAGLPMIVRIRPLSEPAGLDDTLGGMGWRRFDDTRVMVLSELHSIEAPDALSVQELSSDAFAQAIGALRGSPPVQRAAHAERLRQAPVRCRAFVVQRDGETLACGQFVVESDLVGLYDVFTAPTARGLGLARSLCQHLLRQARDEGARRAYLQVEGDNHAARAVYRRLGFADAYAYHYRTRDPQAA